MPTSTQVWPTAYWPAPQVNCEQVNVAESQLGAPAAQSLLSWQALPCWHLVAHEPPQSTSLSVPFF